MPSGLLLSVALELLHCPSAPRGRSLPRPPHVLGGSPPGKPSSPEPRRSAYNPLPCMGQFDFVATRGSQTAQVSVRGAWPIRNPEGTSRRRRDPYFFRLSLVDLIGHAEFASRQGCWRAFGLGASELALVTAWAGRSGVPFSAGHRLVSRIGPDPVLHESEATCSCCVTKGLVFAGASTVNPGPG